MCKMFLLVNCTLVTQDNCVSGSTQLGCFVNVKSKQFFFVLFFWVIGRCTQRGIKGGHLFSCQTLFRFHGRQQSLRKLNQQKHCSTDSPFVERVKPNTGTAQLCDRHAAQHLTVLTTYNPTHRDSHRTISVSVSFKTKKSLDDTTSHWQN